MINLILGTASADTGSIRFVYFDQFEPFSWLEDGRMQGMFIDVINEVFEVRLGIPVEHEGYPWKRAQLMVMEGTADAMCTIATSERREYALPVSTPVVRINFKLFTSADHPDRDRLAGIRSLRDLQDLSLVDITGSGWAATNLKDQDVHFVNTYEHMFLLIKLGRVDAAVRNDWQTLYLIKKTGYSEDIVALPQPMTAEPMEYTILIGRNSPFAAEIDRIDAVLKQMEEEGVIQRLFEKYR